MGKVPATIDPSGEGDEAESEKRSDEFFLTDEAGVNPEEVGGGGEEEEGHALFEGFHPCAWAWKFFDECGEDGEDEVGGCEAGGHGGEAGKELECGESHGCADGGT